MKSKPKWESKNFLFKYVITRSYFFYKIKSYILKKYEIAKNLVLIGKLETLFFFYLNTNLYYIFRKFKLITILIFNEFIKPNFYLFLLIDENFNS